MTLSENATSSIWGNRSSATFPLSLARTATPACSTFASISPREAGQDYGTVVVVVVVVDPWILIRGGSNHHTSMPAIFISFLERAYVCVERFARQTLYFFFFFFFKILARLTSTIYHFRVIVFRFIEWFRHFERCTLCKERNVMFP